MFVTLTSDSTFRHNSHFIVVNNNTIELTLHNNNNNNNTFTSQALCHYTKHTNVTM